LAPAVAIALHMVGARPVQEGTGRIARFELIPLAELGGRPRVDVLCNMSGIFRDSFQNVVELMDDCFQVRPVLMVLLVLPLVLLPCWWLTIRQREGNNQCA
jgi:cobalamin biosynthesis Mg chelatase CobN